MLTSVCEPASAIVAGWNLPPRPILYLHGFASGPSSRKARFFKERLEQAGRSLEIPDLTEGDFEGLTISGQLAVVERTLGGSAAILIGSSMGGYLAALYAARHPEVRRLLLLAPAFGFARRWPETLGPEALQQWRRTGRRAVPHYATGKTEYIGYSLIEDGNKYEEFPDVPCETRIYHGANDEVVPVSFSREFAAGRANVALRVLDSDHELLNCLETIWTETESFLVDGDRRSGN